METLGWYFDLRYSHWSARPITRKIEKIAHYLFNVIRSDDTTTTLPFIQSLAGLLCWYAVAIPIGRSFVYTLFQCNKSSTGTVFIHAAAQRDLSFWRAIMRVALDNPSLLACPIDLLRTDRAPTWFIVTDASTGTGGGAWISASPTWNDDPSALWFGLRWTITEQAAIAARLSHYGEPTADEWSTIEPFFQEFKIAGDHTAPTTAPLTINVLEFAQAVFTIMAAAPKLRGSVVSFGADNTATLCWLVRNRSSPGAADILLKLLAMTCTMYNIKLVVHHVKGAVNFLSDWISRVAGAAFIDPHTFFLSLPAPASSEFLAALQKAAYPPTSHTRTSICRAILSHALSVPSDPSASDLILMISLLRHFPDVYVNPDPRIPRVLTAFQRLRNANQHPETIPHSSLEEALSAASAWDEIII